MFPKATTLGALRKDVTAGRVPRRPVKSEIRDNLITKLRAGETLFPGIIGYDDTVVPQVVNAILSRHNFILLGLRGQAKTRILRALTSLLDEAMPVVPGCEIHDDPLAPICAACRARVKAEGDDCAQAAGVTPPEMIVAASKAVRMCVTLRKTDFRVRCAIIGTPPVPRAARSR